MDRSYVIINREDVETIDFSQVVETSEDTLRWNKEKDKTFVKFYGDNPSFLKGKTTENKSEMRTTLKDGDWGVIEE